MNEAILSTTPLDGTGASRSLASFASNVTYDQIPADVIARIKHASSIRWP